MIIKVASGNRISLPKKFIEDYNIKQGDCFDITFNEGKFILNPVGEEYEEPETLKSFENKLEKNNINNKSNLKLPILKTQSPNEFISNLEEGQKFSRKYYSECGLLIRTKNAYIKKYCENCQGKMLDNYEGLYNCPYKRLFSNNIKKLDNKEVVKSDKIEEVIKKESNNIKETIHNIHCNIFKAEREIDKKISDNKSTQECKLQNYKKILMNTPEDINVFDENKHRNDNTIIKFIQYNHYHECSFCKSYTRIGFLIDNIQFLCSSCAKKDFIDYINKIKEDKFNV